MLVAALISLVSLHYADALPVRIGRETEATSHAEEELAKGVNVFRHAAALVSCLF